MKVDWFTLKTKSSKEIESRLVYLENESRILIGLYSGVTAKCICAVDYEDFCNFVKSFKLFLLILSESVSISLGCNIFTYLRAADVYISEKVSKSSSCNKCWFYGSVKGTSDANTLYYAMAVERIYIRSKSVLANLHC